MWHGRRGPDPEGSAFSKPYRNSIHGWQVRGSLRDCGGAVVVVVFVVRHTPADTCAQSAAPEQWHTARWCSACPYAWRLHTPVRWCSTCGGVQLLKGALAGRCACAALKPRPMVGTSRIAGTQTMAKAKVNTTHRILLSISSSHASVVTLQEGCFLRQLRQAAVAEQSKEVLTSCTDQTAQAGTLPRFRGACSAPYHSPA
jgi:hypothetical protein